MIAGYQRGILKSIKLEELLLSIYIFHIAMVKAMGMGNYIQNTPLLMIRGYH